MKQFAKAVTIFAGVVVLLAVGAFGAKIFTQRSAQADANMRAILQANTEYGAASAVYNTDDGDEIVTIPDEIVITEEFIPPREQGIPVGPGTAVPILADTAQTARYLFDQATAFLASAQYGAAVQAQLQGEASGKIILDASQPASGLAQAFFSDFLGVSDYAKAFAGCRVGITQADGETAVEFASCMQGDTAAAYAARHEQACEAQVITEVTEVTVLSGNKRTIVTTTIVTTHTPDGTDVQSSVSTKTQAVS